MLLKVQPGPGMRHGATSSTWDRTLSRKATFARGEKRGGTLCKQCLGGLQRSLLKNSLLLPACLSPGSGSWSLWADLRRATSQGQTAGTTESRTAVLPSSLGHPVLGLPPLQLVSHIV